MVILIYAGALRDAVASEPESTPGTPSPFFLGLPVFATMRPSGSEDMGRSSSFEAKQTRMGGSRERESRRGNQGESILLVTAP